MTVDERKNMEDRINKYDEIMRHKGQINKLSNQIAQKDKMALHIDGTYCYIDDKEFLDDFYLFMVKYIKNLDEKAQEV